MTGGVRISTVLVEVFDDGAEEGRTGRGGLLGGPRLHLGFFYLAFVELVEEVLDDLFDE